MMSSCLCFICHNAVKIKTNEEFRDKYRELIGTNLDVDSNLCWLCCHMLDKFWCFKSVCLRRSLEYPFLFSERSTLLLQAREVEIYTLCVEETCNQHNCNSIQIIDINDSHNCDSVYNDYCKDVNIESDVNTTREQENETKEFEKDICINNDSEFDMNQSVEATDNNGLNDKNEDNFDYNDSDVDDLNELEIIENGRKKEKIKNKKCKKKKKEFDKIILSVEEQKAELERNRKEKKYIEAEFKCYNCALGFLFKDTYQAHMMRHEESNGEHRCSLCTLRFASVAVLRSHVVSHSVRRVCRRCGRTLRPRAAALHLARCEGIDLQSAACHMCARMFADSRALQQHLKRFHVSKAGSRSYPCNVCGTYFANPPALRTHMIKHINRKFTCEVCSAIFSSPYTLTKHKKKHVMTAGQDADVHYCAPCEKSFRDRKSLLAHRRHTKRHQEESFECPICSRSCANQRSLNYHIEAVHSTSKNYPCHRCSARYSTEKALKRHIRGHDVKIVAKLAVCHLCGRGFKGNSKLNRHLREVCEKEKLEEELSCYYNQEGM